MGFAQISRVAFRHRGKAELVDSEQGTHLRIRLPRLPVAAGAAAGKAL